MINSLENDPCCRIRRLVPRRLPAVLIASLCTASLAGSVRAQAPVPSAASATPIVAKVDHDDLGRLKWQLAARTATFRRMTTFHMIDYLHSLVVHHLELSSGQALAADHPGVLVGPNMAPDDLAALQAKLKSVKMDVVSYEADSLGRDPAADRKTFAFGKALGVKNIIGAAPDSSLPVLDALATEFSINVAIVNVAKPAIGWDSVALLKTLGGLSPHVGVCADLATWQRSGLDPLKTLQALGSRVIEIRLEDSDNRRVVSMAGGTVNLPPILAWLQAQKFIGIFGVGNGDSSDPDAANHWATLVNAFSADLAALPKPAAP